MELKNVGGIMSKFEIGDKVIYIGKSNYIMTENAMYTVNNIVSVLTGNYLSIENTTGCLGQFKEKLFKKYNNIDIINKFKVGDKIRRTGFASAPLQEGKSYVVNGLVGEKIITLEDLRDLGYLSKNFELIKSSTEQEVAPEEEHPSKLKVWDATSEPFNTTKTEEAIMKVQIEVSNAPYAKTKVITFYGEDASSMDEKKLLSVLNKINHEVDNLVTLQTKGKSTYVKRKLMELSDAKEEVIDMLDSIGV